MSLDVLNVYRLADLDAGAPVEKAGKSIRGRKATSTSSSSSMFANESAKSPGSNLVNNETYPLVSFGKIAKLK